MNIKLKQTAGYWAPSGTDSYGKPSFAAPVEIYCRWENNAEQIMLADGTIKTSRANVFVNQDLIVDGYLFLGKLTDLTDQSIPSNNDGAYIIMQFSKTPSLRGGDFFREAIC